METLLLFLFLSGPAMANDFSLVQSVMTKKPEIDTKAVRVWNIHKTDTIRINLVEFRAETHLHKHPDADHSLMVLEGRVRVLVGEKRMEIGKGDFISIAKNVPHKYWPLDGKAILVSMDAPYYDPKKTIAIE